MRRLRLVLALVCCVGALPLQLRAQDPSRSPVLLIQHVNIIDVRAGKILPDQNVLIEGGRIVHEGPWVPTKPTPDAKVVSGRSQYLIPGLWDMHVHAAWPGIDGIFAPLFVANGVTGVREMFGDMAVVRAWKKRYETGEPWPRMVAAGHILDGPNPIWPGSTVASNAEEARKAVDSLHQAGADFIKVYNRLPHDAYVAAIDEAKRLGTYVAGHVPDAVSVAEASDLGQRSIEHLTGVALECSSEADSLRAERSAATGDPAAKLKAYMRQADRILATQDAARCSDLFARLARNQTWQVPTLTVLRSMASMNDPHFTADPRLRYMPEEVRTSWDWRNDFRFRDRTEEDWAVGRRMNRRAVAIVSAMNRAGIPMLAGTDVLNPFTFPGFSLHDELALLVEAGLSNAEALRAATLNPAIFLHEEDSAGTVEAGKRADLVLLDANPLKDIHNTRRVRAVILNGRTYDRAALDSLIEKAERAANLPR
jgi:imidazolonepropionase-like amidohydrolase